MPIVIENLPAAANAQPDHEMLAMRAGQTVKLTVEQIATLIVALVTDSAPATLDTLNELAAALGDDPNFAATTAAALANRLRIDAAQSLTAQQQDRGRANLAVPGRNLIINGQGRINQRAYVSGTNTAGANQFTLDRWFVVTSGQNLSFTGDDSRRVMTAPAAGVSQVIEGNAIVGGTYVLNWTGTAAAFVNGTARAKGETFTLSANANATVRFQGGTFTDVQLELGNVASAYERLSIAQELALCQRYYEKSFRLTVAPASNTGDTTGATGFLSSAALATDVGVRMVPKRAVPWIQTFSPNAAGSNWSTNSDTPTASVIYQSETSFVIRAASPAAAGRTYQIHWTADAEFTA